MLAITESLTDDSESLAESVPLTDSMMDVLCDSLGDVDWESLKPARSDAADIDSLSDIDADSDSDSLADVAVPTEDDALAELESVADSDADPLAEENSLADSDVDSLADSKVD